MTNKFEKSLDTISKGGAIILIGSLLGKALAFISKAALARFFGPQNLGLLALSLMLLGIVTKFSAGGFSAALKKFIPSFQVSDEEHKVRGTVFTVIVISTGISAVGGLLLYLFARPVSIIVFNNPDLIPMLKVIGILIPIHSLLIITSNVFLAFKKTKYKVVMRDIGVHSLHLALFSAVILLGGTILDIAYSYVMTAAVLVGISLYLLEKKVYPLVKEELKSKKSLTLIPKKILTYSIPLLFSGLFALTMGWSDTFMLGFFKTEDVVGIYNLVLTITLLLLVFLGSINQIFFPVISDLHSKEAHDDVAKTFSTILRWMFFLTVPFFLFVVIFSNPLLSVFFPEYTGGRYAMIILAVGMMFRAGLGPVGQILKIYDKTKFIFKLNGGLLGLNIILNVLLIPKFGLEGAAVATSSVFILNNIIEMWKVRTLFGFEIDLGSYFKYISAGLFPLIILYLSKLVIPLNWWIMIGFFFSYMISYFFLILLSRALREEDLVIFKVVDLIFERLGLERIKPSEWVKGYIKK